MGVDRAKINRCGRENTQYKSPLQEKSLRSHPRQAMVKGPQSSPRRDGEQGGHPTLSVGCTGSQPPQAPERQPQSWACGRMGAIYRELQSSLYRELSIQGSRVMLVTEPQWPGPNSYSPLPHEQYSPPPPSHEQHPPLAKNTHVASSGPAQWLGHRRQAAAQKPSPWTAEPTHSSPLSCLPVWKLGTGFARSRSRVLEDSGSWRVWVGCGTGSHKMPGHS